MYQTLDELRAELGQKDAPTKGVDPAYAAKMLHPIPKAEVVNRRQFLLERCKGKVVLDVGASGPMHDLLVKEAAKVYGIDREDGPGVVGIDLDDYHAQLPVYPDVDVIVCGEVLEHLSNPGWFLARLRKAYACQTVITVPSAFSEAGRRVLLSGTECVNRDHVAWYSPKTLAVLLERHGYAIREFYFYNGKPIEPAQVSEGLIVVTG